MSQRASIGWYILLNLPTRVMLAHLWGAILKQYSWLKVAPQAYVHTFLRFPRKKYAWLLPTLPNAFEVSTLRKYFTRQLRDFSHLWAHSMGWKSLNYLLPPLTTSFPWTSFTIWDLKLFRWTHTQILQCTGHNLWIWCHGSCLLVACVSLYEHRWAGDLLGWITGNDNRPPKCSLEFEGT